MVGRAESVLVCALLLAVGLSGCIGATGILSDLTGKGAPTLTVGVSHADERSVRVTEATGHYVGFDLGSNGNIERKLEVLDYETRHEQTSSLRADGLDAFMRPLDLVVYEGSTSSTDNVRGETTDLDSVVAFSQANRHLVFADAHWTSSWSSSTCDASGCTSESGTDSGTFRYYPRETQPAGWASLEGHELRVGETVRFNRTVHVNDEYAYEMLVNYTALREDRIGGQRAMVVEPETHIEWIKRPALPASTRPDRSALEDNLPPPPEPVNLQWYTQGASFPIKTVVHTPFEFEDQWFWSNTTSTVESHQIEGPPIAWGQGKAAPMPHRREGAHPYVPVKDYVASSAEADVTYPMADAWAAIDADPTMVTFTAFRAQNPDAWPYKATYVPDPDNDTYTWSFLVGDEEEQIKVESRLRHVAGDPDLAVVRNRVPTNQFVFEAPISDEAAAGLTLSDLADALDVYATVGPGSEEPVIDVRLTEGWGLFSSGPVVVFADAARARSDASSFIFSNIDETAVELDLTDGGITVLGFSILLMDRYQPIWLPYPVGMGLEALGPGAHLLALEAQSPGSVPEPLLKAALGGS